MTGLAPPISQVIGSDMKNATTATSYSPLDDERDEIRLISLFPCAAESDLVRCTVETVSLRALTPEYQSFLSSSGPTVGGKRNRMKLWAEVQPRIESVDVTPDSVHKQTPTKLPYRFVWGDYAALSYVWGDPGMTRRIIVNDQEMLVGQNLESALRALSNIYSFQDGFRLWIDGICINQQDYEERGRQIGKMRQIYGGAWKVIAWLGEEHDNCSKAFQLIRTLSDTSPGQGKELETKLLIDPKYLGDGSWIALHDLMDNDYWYRLWIIQELVLGSSALVLHWSYHSIDWATFCEGIGFLFDYLWTAKDVLLFHDIRSSGLNRDARWTTTSLHLVHENLWPLSLSQEPGRAYLPFDRLLNVASSANCQDPRDKVYGLVGLMDPFVSEHLVPNYKSPTSVVFASVSKAFILNYKNLDPIREGNPWSRIGTPSWAVDWTWDGRLRQRNPENCLWGPFWTQKGAPKIENTPITYRASGATLPEFSFSQDDLYLTCRGFIVDKVAGLSARESGIFRWSKSSIIQSKQDRNMYGSVDGVSKALYHALVADRVASGLRASERHAAILNLPSTFKSGREQFERLQWHWLATLHGYYYRWEQWRRANRDFRLMGRRLQDYFRDEIPDGASEYDYTEVFSCFDRTSKGRRFMTTSKGYLGWAPDNLSGDNEEQAKIEDLIVILYGCSSPLVIRPHGQYFLVVGEAYVQGLMDGEALDFLNAGNCVLQDFTFI